MASHRRGPWSQAEDAYLIQLVHTQGALNWVRISQLIGTRTPKQCRERYHQNLKPSLNHDPITPEEGLQIERMVAEMGKRWAEIARRLHGRSDNAVKNWWNGSMNRRRRMVVRRRDGASSHAGSDYDERMDGMSYRPATQAPPRTLTLPSPFSPRRSIDPSLPSPAVSEGSRADSVDGAPSLISDSGSTVSISPIVAPSRGLELPPLNHHAAGRRLSHPFVHFDNQVPYSSEAESYAARYSHEASKAHSLSPLNTPSTRRPEPSSSRAYPPPPRAFQLPPLQQQGTYQSEKRESASRDSRMHLSSLLL